MFDVDVLLLALGVLLGVVVCSLFA